MAITIEQAPADLNPAYNDVIYYLTSSNSGQDNFKFVVDLYVGGIKVDRMLVPVHPTLGTGKINVAPLLENRVNTDINLSDDRVKENLNSYIGYVLKFGEAYGTTGTIVYPDLHVTGTKYLWNGVYDFPDYVAYSSGDIVASSGTPCSFLTNKPSSGDINVDDNAWLYVNDFNNVISYFYFVSRDTSGATINTTKINNNIPTKKFLRLPTGYNNILTIPDSQLTAGIQPLLNGSEHMYSIQGFDSGNNAVTERYFYTLVSNCSRYPKRRLQFLNKLGGYDFFDFTLVSKENTDIERSIYKKGLGTASSHAFTYTNEDRGYSQFHTRLKDKVSIQSDFVAEDVYAWLEELISSPDVRLDDGTNLIPINITTATHEKKQVVNEKLFNLSIEYTLSYDRYRQRL